MLFFICNLFFALTLAAQLGNLATTTPIHRAELLQKAVTNSPDNTIIMPVVATEQVISADTVMYSPTSPTDLLNGLMAILLIGVILNVFLAIQNKFIHP